VSTPDPSSSPPLGTPSITDPGNFIFAGGGSGGHIYPGLAIAEELRRLSTNPNPNPPGPLFVVSDRALDAKIMKDAGYPFERSPARPMIVRPKGLVRFAFGWFAAKSQARYILRIAQDWPAADDVHIVAMGGFVAAPFVRVAKRLGLPVTMVNLDAVPGKANKYIARHADRIFTAARVPPEHRAGREWIEVPPIVRAAARATKSRDECRRALALDPARPVLMITGGSQGLASLNNFAAAFAASPAGQRSLRQHHWQVLHQTGTKFEAAVRAAYQSANIDATVVPFTDQMALWYGASDLALCTAGAGNIAEIWMNKVPALLLPYPHHKDEHQKFNAAPLSDADGAVIGKDLIEAAANLRQNGPALESLLSDGSRRATMRVNLEKLGPADGATRIARALLDSVGKGSASA
jgi:UDP-N-acetylglucosamine--N-acetylmuramyl-(pentapeptide) pyrophosphoryl-undecaprenol N-acetylglucosamine transferase